MYVICVSVCFVFVFLFWVVFRSVFSFLFGLWRVMSFLVTSLLCLSCSVFCLCSVLCCTFGGLPLVGQGSCISAVFLWCSPCLSSLTSLLHVSPDDIDRGVLQYIEGLI